MSYDRHFSTDWTRLSRDEAMVRAYALGVDAALGEDRPDEFQRLLGEDKRALIEMAFNEGKRKALRMQAEIEDENGPGYDRNERNYEIWDRLLVYRRGESEQEPSGRSIRRSSRIDVPATLQRLEALDLPKDDLDRLGLPDFLYR